MGDGTKDVNEQVWRYKGITMNHKAPRTDPGDDKGVELGMYKGIAAMVAVPCRCTFTIPTRAATETAL